MSEAPLHIDHEGLFEVDVVGESNYQEALAAIAGGVTREGADHATIATLVREPNNRYDPNAVRVDIDGRTVGYLSRDDAESYCAQLAAFGNPLLVVTTDALILGGWNRGGGDTGMFGVRLDLPPLDE